MAYVKQKTDHLLIFLEIQEHSWHMSSYVGALDLMQAASVTEVHGRVPCGEQQLYKEFVIFKKGILGQELIKILFNL